MNNYQEWIDINVPNYSSAYGNCEDICNKMILDFPELKIVRGHYYCILWGQRMHWWLKDLKGNIVDPTAKQFPTKGNGVYEEWIEGDEEPTGVCPNCGEYYYGGRYCCTDDCEKSFVVSLN